jgi:hypothetical protein
MNAQLNYRFDPANADLIRDPYPTYRRLQGEPGLHLAAGNYWVATRYAEVCHVLMHRDFGQGDFVRNIQMFYPPDFDVLSHSSFRWLSEVFLCHAAASFLLFGRPSYPTNPYTRVLYRPANSAKVLFFGESPLGAILYRFRPPSRRDDDLGQLSVGRGGTESLTGGPIGSLSGGWCRHYGAK